MKKSRLFEIYLSYRDFGCNPEDYLLDLELTKRQENNNQEVCYWFEDIDGRLIVDRLNLDGFSKRLEITTNGFIFIGAMQKVFISYAKEDKECARRLYKELKDKGFDPWLDEESLLPGQKWEAHIEDAIKQCEFFIALLSTKSVGKRGYFQKEIRRALDVLETVPERDIFLIPARLERVGWGEERTPTCCGPGLMLGFLRHPIVDPENRTGV